jgi:hypothetical protein
MRLAKQQRKEFFLVGWAFAVTAVNKLLPSDNSTLARKICISIERVDLVHACISTADNAVKLASRMQHV